MFITVMCSQSLISGTYLERVQSITFSVQKTTLSENNQKFGKRCKYFNMYLLGIISLQNPAVGAFVLGWQTGLLVH